MMSDHDVQSALTEVESICKQKSIQLTPIRKLAFSLLLTAPNGLKAYELLDKIKLQKSSATPPTAYRALDFLLEHGFAHKISKLNTFVACKHLCHHADTPSFLLICPCCQNVTEYDNESMNHSLIDALAASGFRLMEKEIEITATCPGCLTLGR
ncbi:transcriptional repressor [Iodobacter arcticus]|uniref:Transcriptional repressor n=1 Tax=Iodobacter arcticus TaxID=590593 RepID=A0ABW2R1C5_9NEIS